VNSLKRRCSSLPNNENMKRLSLRLPGCPNPPLMQSLRDDSVLVPCKAAGLGWETVSAVLESRFATGSIGPHESAKAREQFARLTTENARRLLRFWQVRSSPLPSSVN
jgi:hypothetical protein